MSQLLQECGEVIIVAERRLVYEFNKSRSDRAILLPRPITGRFNDLAYWLLEQHPCRDMVTADGRRLETFYRAEALQLFRNAYGMVWQEELDLISADMAEMRSYRRRTPELRVVRAQSYTALNYEFHQDGGDRVMSCYNGPTTEFIQKQHVTRHQSGPYPYFRKIEGAPVFHPGIGDIWWQAGCGEGLIHRAVEIGEGDPPRLLVVC